MNREVRAYRALRRLLTAARELLAIQDGKDDDPARGTRKRGRQGAAAGRRKEGRDPE